MSSHLAHLTANQRVGLVAAVMRATGLSWDNACKVTEDALELHLGVYAMRLAETVAGYTRHYPDEAKWFMDSVHEFAAEDAANTDTGGLVEPLAEESATPRQEEVSPMAACAGRETRLHPGEAAAGRARVTPS